MRMLQVSKLNPNPKIVSTCRKLIIPLTMDVPDICKKPETAAAAPAIFEKGCSDKATILENAKPMPIVNINKQINVVSTVVSLRKPVDVTLCVKK